jgi:hypothetical protein
MTKENISLGWKSIAREKALAYFPSPSIVKKYSYITITLIVNVIQHFLLLTYKPNRL